jgi:Flp pilus assembly protein TadG
MTRRLAPSVGRDRRGSVLVEFAFVGPVLLMVSLGAMELGLILWTQGALQTVAAEAARCGAIGATACTSSSAIESWVKTVEAPTWIPSDVASSLTVNVNGEVNTTACPTISVGTFETVEITTSYYWLPWPLSNYKIDVCASYAS